MCNVADSGMQRWQGIVYADDNPMITLISANAARPSTRVRLSNHRLSLSLRKADAPWHESVDVAEADVIS